ncbi:E3 ubiquitin-protein ligase RNF169 isoform X2 [Esox lucius]|uniref:E3 ubiquitin-protein ligase RNF169 isoform X2 n=1 Tax=Esox lucius TaxID=8010 RepID=UPI00057722DE|nr:E3 ubiquitin-protein ligase RNF169 isoform X2 [Esox lucius]
MKMAATGSARSIRGLGQKCKARPADMLQTRTPSQLLTLDEARCPVCSEILLEPVTMPCSHSVCLHCFKRTVEFTSLCCPLCRLRVSSWARKQSREKSLVNTELGEMVRKSYPERCQKKMEQRDSETIGEELFRSPAQISKPGESIPENVKQKVKFYGLQSDSENEEPIGKRTRNVSAFVRRTKISAAFNRDGIQTNVVQRSQSCTDTEEGRQRMRFSTHLPGLDKASIPHSYSAGILLSSENSRSLSAPITIQDKRLPDGRVMEPTIVKSTPRNLIRSLQRPTNYEASPTILQKWKQIEVDRQSVKVISKGTLTTPVNEDLVFKPSLIKEEVKPFGCAPEANTAKECLGTYAKADSSRLENERTILHNKRRLIFDQATGETTPLQKHSAKFHTPSLPFSSEVTVTGCGVSSESLVVPQSHCGLLSLHHNQTIITHNKNANVKCCQLKSKDSQYKINELDNGNCSQNQPTSRRGKKRSQKTKHLEETGPTPKRPKSQSQEGFNIECAQTDLYIQEREDRQLALKLQRQFDLEQQIADKQKASPDKYFLRSWVSSENQIECNPRRSGRISQKNKHFKCNY